MSCNPKCPITGLPMIPILLIIVGAYFLAVNQGWIVAVEFKWWPIVLIVVGVLGLAKGKCCKSGTCNKD